MAVDHHVSQVGRTATDAHQVHKHAQLVLYALPDRKPVQASENGSDVIPFPDSRPSPIPNRRLLQ